MFARQAMSLLEWAALLCTGDTSGGALNSLTAALAYIDRRYFTVLPADCVTSDRPIKRLPLPTLGKPKRELLRAVFDLPRHGLAHQYQQVVVGLKDGTDFSVALSGAEYGRSLATIRASRPERVEQGTSAPGDTIHLKYRRDSKGIRLALSPAVMYLDIKRAIELTGLLSHTGDFPYQHRDGVYEFTADQLEAALRGDESAL